MDIGKRIRELRERRGIEQIELAAKIEISQSKMNKIETGFQKRIEPELLTAIARTLSTSVDYLVGATDDPTPLSWELPDGISEEWYRALDPDKQEFIKALASSDAFALSGNPKQFLKEFEEFQAFKRFSKEFDKKRKKKED